MKTINNANEIEEIELNIDGKPVDKEVAKGLTIHQVGLSIRAIHVLCNANIKSVGQIIGHMNSSQLCFLRHRNAGTLVVDELRECLLVLGFTHDDIPELPMIRPSKIGEISKRRIRQLNVSSLPIDRKDEMSLRFTHKVDRVQDLLNVNPNYGYGGRVLERLRMTLKTLGFTSKDGALMRGID